MTPKPLRRKVRAYPPYDYEFRWRPVNVYQAEFLAHDQIVNPRQLNAHVYEDADSFVAAALTTGAVFLTPSVFSDTPETFAAATVATVGDPTFASVVLLVPFDGVDAAAAATDIKGHALTFVGNAQLDTAEKKFGSASLLGDGTGDYVSTPDSDDWRFPGEFTVEAWARPNTAGAVTSGIVAHGGATSGTWGWKLEFVATSGSLRRFRFTYYHDGATGTVVQTAQSAIDISVFHHVAATRDASDVIRLFVDGVLEATSAPRSGSFDSTALLYIGASVGSTNSMNGWVDDVRLTKGACRYSAAFTPPTVAFPTS
jgi:hypothetical protein